MSLPKEGVFPDDMKIAKVSPISQGGNDLQAENYRPIPVLPVFSIIFEKTMYNRVYNYFVENKLLFPKQLGFQINTSNEHAVLEFVRNIIKSFEKKRICAIRTKAIWNKRCMIRMVQKLSFKLKSLYCL